MWRNGRPVLESGRHEEIAVERKVGARGFVQVAGFHDDNNHVALFGRGAESSLRQNSCRISIPRDLPTMAVIRMPGALVSLCAKGSATTWNSLLSMLSRARWCLRNVLDAVLRDAIRTEPLHSLGANVNARVPRTQHTLQRRVQMDQWAGAFPR